VLLAGTTTAAEASTRTLTVEGAVTTPASYTASQLKALGETTYPQVTGVDLTKVVAVAAAVLPPGKNTALRVP
jgi:pyruvate-formate lyase-activating enzyme